MNVMINSVHFKADKKLEAFINEKLGKLGNFFDGLIGAEVKLKLENIEEPENKTIEVRLIVKGNDLFAEKSCKSFEEATDITVEALRRQLLKHKDKVRGK
jgi:putative sigma-54 modulation protein